MNIKAYLCLMRWHRPTPILLILWPTYWGLFLGQLPSWRLGLIFSIGVLLMRTAGCVINDCFDQKQDACISRTKERPLAAKTISTQSAVCLLLLLLLASAGLLYFLNPLTQILAVPALILACCYPLAKRFTYFPQIFLGLAFNFGMIMAYAAVNDRVDAFIFCFYGLSILWTLLYDSLYALMDYEDDVKVGVKSPATYFHGRVYLFIFILMLSLVFGSIFCLHVLKIHAGLAVIIWLGISLLLLSAAWRLMKAKLIVLLPLLVMRFQFRGTKFPLWSNPMLVPKQQEAKIYQQLFNDQHWFGLLFFLAILAQHLS